MAHTGWSHFPHGADIGVRGTGPTKEAAFEQGAMALAALITDPGAVQPREQVEVECSAPDDALLFADWLNALIFEMAHRRMLFGKFVVHLDDGVLRGSAWGEPVNVTLHQPAVEVKGATYTELRVARDPDGGWIAQCVVDV